MVQYHLVSCVLVLFFWSTETSLGSLGTDFTRFFIGRRNSLNRLTREVTISPYNYYTCTSNQDDVL